MEIRVTEMNASDEITIRTEFSDYSFRLTDPVQCRGILTGGPLGDQQHDAFFAGQYYRRADRSAGRVGWKRVTGPSFSSLETAVIG